jgi:hypothetical protein
MARGLHDAARMKTSRAFFLIAALAGCATDKTDIGDTTVGQYSFHVFREGPACTAGVDTTLVLKATAGGKPSSIVAWVGVASAEGSEKVTAVYDSGDSDFDIDMTCPDPMPAGAKFFFLVDGSATGSIDLK